MKITKAIIPAAGLGTRFLPATKAQPKEMLPIVDKPTIQYIVEEAVASGIEDIIIVTGRSKRAIEDHFDKSYELENELQKSGKEELLELCKRFQTWRISTISAKKSQKDLVMLYCVLKALSGNQPFAVLLGDDVVDAFPPCLEQMIDVFNVYNTSVLGVQHVSKNEVDKYGIVECEIEENKIYRVRDLVEKPPVDKAPSDIAILGRYIITPTIFDILENTKPGAGGEIQLTDALKVLSKTEPMYAYDFTGRRYDVGNRMGFLRATVEYALKREELHDEFLDYLEKIIKKER